MTAIITGGAQGIGAAMCRALLKKGYKVCVADLQEEKGQKFVNEQQIIHGADNVIFSFCDVTKEEDFKRTFELAISVFETVDVLINNAGVNTERNPKMLIDVNLMGPIYGCQAALKYMGKSQGGKGGMVINVASITGLKPYYPIPHYSASKHAIIGLTRCYGLPPHEEKEGILFAVICPSLTDTDLLKSFKDNKISSTSDISKNSNVMSPDYVAQGAVKLLEDRINGSVLIVTKTTGYHYFKFQEEIDDLHL